MKIVSKLGLSAVVTLLLAVLLPVGASWALTQEPAHPAPPTVSVAPGKLGAPAEGKGQIVFFRPPNRAGMVLRFSVREGKVELGKLGNGRYFVVDVEPGDHIYAIHSKDEEELALNIEPGNVYYVEWSFTWTEIAEAGRFTVQGFRPNLLPSTQETFDSVAKTLKPAT